eukprot:1070748_1
MATFLFSFFLFLATSVRFTFAAFPPEQVHIAYYGTPDQMSFTWLTWDYPVVTHSIVRIGLQPFTSQLSTNVSGNAHLFTDCGSAHLNRTIHVANVSSLSPSTTYYYQVGDPYYGWSSIYPFTTLPDATTLSHHLPIKYVIYGDLGDVNAQTLTSFTEYALSSPSNVDMILHLGDFAYDFLDQNGNTGDAFMRDISTVAASVPYMTCPGNHERGYNFSHYSQRFRGQPPNLEYPTVWTLSGPTPNNWFFSWNSGLTHFAAIDTEIYFDFPALISIQWNWLKADLIAANKNRTAAPWIVVFGHKALYCSSYVDLNHVGCSAGAELVRWGPKASNGSYVYGMEELFYEYGVDFYMCGHQHNYERMYDIYQSKTTQTTNNMASTTYIVTGSAGNKEHHSGFAPVQPQWSAFRTTAYSYTMWDVYNATHVHLRQYVADNTLPAEKQGVCDDVWYIQEKHGSFRETYGAKDLSSHVYGMKKSITWDAYGDKNELYQPNNRTTYLVPYVSDHTDYTNAKHVYLNN